MADEVRARGLQAVGVEPIGWPSVEEMAWFDDVSSHAAIGVACANPELREGALRILAGFRADEARQLVLASLDRVASGELGPERDDAATWAKSATERLRQHWSPANVSIGEMLNVLADIAEAVRTGGVTGFYVVAQTDYDTTDSWTAGEYDRQTLYFALGHAQHRLLVHSEEHHGDGDT